MVRATDRISELPDTLRQQILCLLPRKSAIRTSALSSRWKGFWRYRWPYATVLIFGEEFRQGVSAGEFASSIDKFLKLRGNKKVEIFRLCFHPGTLYRSNIVSWIEYAVGNGVEELYLDFCQEFKLLNYLLHGESLTVLDLKHCQFLLPLDFTRLRYLEKVSLKHVNVTDDVVVDVVASCPFLEKLDLRQCPELRSIRISGSDLRLRSLIVVDCFRANEIEIFAPNLQSFRFYGVFLNEYAFEEISSLSDVVMSSLGRDPRICQANWINIIADLAHVKVLTLCSRAVQHIAVPKLSTPIVLGNLQELQLLMDLMTETNLSDIIGFFKKCHCTKLQKIFIELPTCSKDPSPEMYLKVPSGEELPGRCDFSSLRIIKMNNFNNYRSELELVRFFSENAAALESMILVVPQEMDALTWLYCNAMMQVKASAKAKIEVCVASQDSSRLFPTHCDVYY